MNAPATDAPLAPALAQLRVELLLQLPARSEMLLDGLANYNPENLTAWLLDRVAALVQAEGTALALTEVESLERTQAATIELASAGSTFAALTEWGTYLAALPPILRRGLSIKDAHDLAATIETEHQRVVELLRALLEKFPALADLLGDAIGARARGLVSVSGVELT